jgi:O-antigen/teichoic acid export membrane protein
MRSIAVPLKNGRSLSRISALSMPDAPLNSGGTAPSIASGDKILSNVLSLSGGDVLSRVIAFAGTAYLTRKLGPAGFGVIGFALALRSYFALVTTGGSDSMAAREVARRPSDAPAIAASVILVRLVFALLAMGAMAMIAWLIDKPLVTKLVIVLSGLSFLTLAVDTSWAYKGLERNRPVAVSMILGQTLFVVLVLLFVRGPGDVVYVPVAQFTGEVVAASVLTMVLLRVGTVKWHFSEGLRILRSSGNLLASQILRTLIFNFDVLLLGLLLGEKPVGLYVAPYRFCFLLLAIAAAIQASYLPAFTRAAAVGPVALGQITKRAIAFSAAVSAPLVVGGMIVARPLLWTLFGPDYVDGTGAFRLLILSIGLIFLHGHLHSIFIVRDQTFRQMLIITAGTALNIALNFLLIPAWGITGAAASTVTAEGLILLLLLLVICRTGVRFSADGVCRPVVAAAMMGAVLLGLRIGGNLALSMAVGSAVYVAALVLLRGIPEDVRLRLWSSRD